MPNVVPGPVLTRAFRRLTLGVCIFSAVISGACGLLAPMAYYNYGASPQSDNRPANIGVGIGIVASIALGVFSGVAAGWLWSYLMRRFSVRRLERGNHLPGYTGFLGAGLGVTVGVAATVFLHVGLVALAGFRSDPMMGISMGVCFGIPAGLFLGAVCGDWWRRAVNKAIQIDSPAATVVTPSSGEDTP